MTFINHLQSGGKSISTLKNNNQYENRSNTYLNQACDFYNFTGEELEKVFGLKDIDISVNIIMEAGVAFLSSPVKIDGQNIFSLRQLDEDASVSTGHIESAMNKGKIRIDEIANYGTGKKIKLTLNLDEVDFENETYNYTDFKIRRAYYKTKKDNRWDEVDNLKECEYGEDGKTVTFIVYESGDYQFKLEDTNGGTVSRMERYTKFNIRNVDSKNSYTEISSSSYYNIILCNAPQLTSDMIPIKWIYEDSTKRSGFWVICTTIDPEWYNYSEDKKMWANVMFKKDSARGATGTYVVGEQIAESTIGSTFVWVPRFTSRINTSQGTKLGYNIQFVRDTSNTTTFGTNASGQNLKIPVAFKNDSGKQGSWDTELKGLWFAKYDTGLEVESASFGGSKVMWDNRVPVGETTYNYDMLYNQSQNFYAVSKPYHVAWSEISIPNAFSQALMFYKGVSTLNSDGSANINSHMMKKTEYDILQIITREPKVGTASLKANVSNRYTGGSDGKNGFSVMNYLGQSSNGNITGIFDVAGTVEARFPAFVQKYDGVPLNIMDSKGNALFRSYFTDKEPKLTDAEYNSYCSNYKNKYLSLYASSSTRVDPFFYYGENKNFEANKEEHYGYNDKYYGVEKSEAEEKYSYGMGFRIILANSPSGTSDNFIYDQNNFPITEKWPGFFVTDDTGNPIMTAGEYKDGSGNPTYYSLEDLIENNYLRYNSGNKTLLAGSKIADLKKKTGKFVFGKLDTAYSAGNSDEIEKFGDSLFKNWNKNDSGGSLLSVDMRASNVKVLSSSLFENCTDLKEVMLSNVLETIGSKAFSRCTSLNNVELPSSLKRIGGTDASLGSLTNGLYNYKSLSGESFANCTNLNSIVIPSSVEIIGCKSFYGCSNLSSVVFEDRNPGKNFIISAHAFSKTGINSLKFPTGMSAQIQKCAFSECHNLTSVMFYPYGICSLDYGVFWSCENLETFKLVDSYTQGSTSIQLLEDTFSTSYTEPGNYGAFQNCSALKTIDISLFGNNFNKFIPEKTFYGCTSLGLEDVKSISENITTIKAGAFRNCISLGTENNHFAISDKVTSIGAYAFGSDASGRIDLYIDYGGTTAQWNAISKNNWFTNANVIVNTLDGTVNQ